MKKTIILAAVLLLSGFAAKAQNYMVVNSETIFRSIDAYNEAIETLDKLSEQYQKQVDDAFAEVERMFNDYQSVRASLSESGRQQREDAIISREREINKFQEEIFGQDGEIMKKRIELIKPIQDKVFNAIAAYARNNSFDIVLDLASNPTILYYSSAADKTEEIIKIVK